jgi:hypothetical protein
MRAGWKGERCGNVANKFLVDVDFSARGLVRMTVPTVSGTGAGNRPACLYVGCVWQERCRRQAGQPDHLRHDGQPYPGAAV